MRSLFVLLLVAGVYVYANLWDNYQNIAHPPGLKGVDFSTNDGSIIAKSNEFSPSKEELKKIGAQFKNPNDVKANGITIDGVKYTGVSGDANKLAGKKGSSGVIIVKGNGVDEAFAGVYDSNLRSQDADYIMNSVQQGKGGI